MKLILKFILILVSAATLTACGTSSESISEAGATSQSTSKEQSISQKEENMNTNTPAAERKMNGASQPRTLIPNAKPSNPGE